MTAAAPTDTDEPIAVFMWMAQPNVGREEPLMVIINHPEHGPTYRPLIFADDEQAGNHRDIAQEAASWLGVKAVLREFHAVAVLDVTEQPT